MQVRTSNTRLVLALLLAVFALGSLAPSRASAIDVWTEPNPGIRHLHRTTAAPAEFHALVIDLDAPGVQIRCTPPRERWKATSAYARDANLAAAINGGFWGLFGQGAQGLASGGGQIWSIDDERHGFFAVTAEGRAWISTPADVVAPNRRRMMEAVSGRPLIVDHGRIASELWTFPGINSLEPRSVVGVSENGRRVIFATVDGRRATSHGGRLGEMAELLIELGAWRGVNLDGGGSTTLFVAAEGGVVNRPSRGWEREVVNHIGVIAPPPVAPAAATQRTVETPPAVNARAQQDRLLPQASGDVEAHAKFGTRERFLAAVWRRSADRSAAPRAKPRGGGAGAVPVGGVRGAVGGGLRGVAGAAGASPKSAVRAVEIADGGRAEDLRPEGLDAVSASARQSDVEKRIARDVGRAIADFGLIEAGDRVMVAVSAAKTRTRCSTSCAGCSDVRPCASSSSRFTSTRDSPATTARRCASGSRTKGTRTRSFAKTPTPW